MQQRFRLVTLTAQWVRRVGFFPARVVSVRSLGVCLTASGLLVGSVACSKKETPKETPTEEPQTKKQKLNVDIKFSPDAEQKAQAEALVKQLDKKNSRFPTKEAHKRSNARLFTYLAASSDDAAVVRAALSAMYGAYSSHSKKKASPDEDFVAVVKHHLGSEDPTTVARALLAARTAVSGKKGNRDLIQAVANLSGKYKTGPGRYALIDTLRVVSSNNRDDKMMEVFTSSLDDEHPYVQSYALQALYRSTRSIKQQNLIKAKAISLSKHSDPGVRGRAVELLGSLGRGDQAALDVALAALEDEHPYVRSEAADALARLRHQPAIHKLMELIDDKEKNRYDIKGWTTLEGRPGRLHHDGSAWSYVYDAAMNAIRSLSGGDLKLDRINPKQIQEGLDANAKKTQAWYAKEKAKLPKFTPTLETADTQAAAQGVGASNVKPKGMDKPSGATKPKGTPKPTPPAPASP